MRSELQAIPKGISKRSTTWAGMLAGLSVVVLLSGCSLFSGKKEANPPSPLVEFKQTLTIHKQWSVSVGKAGSFLFVPAVASGSVFAASADGTVVRINAKTGEVLWRINAGTTLTAGVGSDGSTVAVVGSKGNIRAFDGNGKSIWEAQAPSAVLSAPAVGQGLVVVRSIDNSVTAYSAEDGTRRWSVVRPLPSLTLRSAPGIVLNGQSAIVAQPGGRLASLALNNGGGRWEIAVADPRGTTELERIADVSGIPAVGDNDVCVTSYHGRIGCFDLPNGNVRWAKDFSSDVGVSLSDRYVFAADDKGQVDQFARDTGALLWQNVDLAYRGLSVPIAAGSAVAVGDYQGYIHFLSVADGHLVARTSTDGSPVLPTPVAAGSAVIFQTQDGTLVALATE